MTHCPLEKKSVHRIGYKNIVYFLKNRHLVLIGCVSSCFKDKNHPKTTGTDSEKGRDWIVGWKLVVVKSRKTRTISSNRQ